MSDNVHLGADAGAAALASVQTHRELYHRLHTEMDRGHVVVTAHLRAALRELQTEVEASCRTAERVHVAAVGQESGPSPPA